MQCFLLALSCVGMHAYTNVNGASLERCSGAGMALTGFTRTGECIDLLDDVGSHHVHASHHDRVAPLTYALSFLTAGMH